MRRRAALLAALAITTGCTREYPADTPVVPPSRIMDFSFLYARNCAGCHGPDGKGGAAIGLGDPVYLAIADNATITRVAADGVPGTAMPAFAQHSGGMLTNDQIDVIAKGIRATWAKADASHDPDPPPYAAQSPGDPARGAAAYNVYCASCHGAAGRGGTRAGSIVEPSYLALVSDQNLRTTVIAGRPELGAPDWRGNVPGKPMSPRDVSDVVAWLSSQRPQSSAQPKLQGEIR
jgi:mono/diheme cytochrome c family protein